MTLPLTGIGRREGRLSVRRGADRSLVRLTGGSLAVSFAVVGFVFLVVPGRVLALFNTAGNLLGMPASPTEAFTLYLALAVAYMYVVTLLAVQMARHPEVTAYPWLLVNAKAASAVVCLILFATQDHYLIYLSNTLIDGAIAASVWAIAVHGAARDDAPALTGVTARAGGATDPDRAAP
jgi:hypothetical protein